MVPLDAIVGIVCDVKAVVVMQGFYSWNGNSVCVCSKLVFDEINVAFKTRSDFVSFSFSFSL